MSETTLYDYAVMTNKPYHGRPEDEPEDTRYHQLDPEVFEKLEIDVTNNSDDFNTQEQPFYNIDFFAQTYVNTTTNEVIIGFRGTHVTGDMLPDWLQLALGLDTDQTDVTEAYTGWVVTQIAERMRDGIIPVQPGATITLVGHSYGGLQAQQGENCLLDLIKDEPDAFSHVGRVRGVGINSPGPGLFEARDGVDFLEIDARGDIVNWGGFDHNSTSEMTVETWAGNFLEAHGIEELLDEFVWDSPPAGAGQIDNTNRYNYPLKNQ